MPENFADTLKSMTTVQVARDALELAQEILDNRGEDETRRAYLEAMEAELAARDQVIESDNLIGGEGAPAPIATVSVPMSDDDTDDDEDIEPEPEGVRDLAEPERALFRGAFTLTVPPYPNPDGSFDPARAVSVEVIIAHDEWEGVASWHEMPERHAAGWSGWGLGPLTVAVRVTD